MEGLEFACTGRIPGRRTLFSCQSDPLGVSLAQGRLEALSYGVIICGHVSKRGGAYIGIHESQEKLAGDGWRSPEIAEELLGVGLRGSNVGSIRQGQGLNEAVCWAESTTTGQTRTRPIDYCAFFVSQGPLTTYLGTVLYGYTARAISDTDLVQGLESTRKTHAHLCDIVYCGTVERYHLPSAPGHNWNHGNTPPPFFFFFFFEPGAHQTTGTPCFFFVHAHTKVDASEGPLGEVTRPSVIPHPTSPASTTACLWATRDSA